MLVPTGFRVRRRKHTRAVTFDELNLVTFGGEPDMKSLVTAAAVLAAVTVAGCGGGAESTARGISDTVIPPAPTTASTTEAAPTTPTATGPATTAPAKPSQKPKATPPPATVTTTQIVLPTCASLALPRVRLLAANWERVVASRGAIDHARYVTNFEDTAEDVDEDYDDLGCDGTRVMLAAEQMEFQAELLAQPFDQEPPGLAPRAGDYDRVALAGNRLLKLAGGGSIKFIPIRCAGSVGATPACSAVR
jgi:hypothetical protein